MRFAAVALVLALCACRSEPEFDERYEAAQDTIEAKAESIDAELKARETKQPTPAQSSTAEEQLQR